MSSSPKTTFLAAPFAVLLAAGTLCLASTATGQEAEGRQGTLQERDRPKKENSEIATVRRRLKVMRYAVDVFVEAGKHDAADLVERAMHTRELAIKGVRNEKARKVAEQAPNRGQLAELLGSASNLYEKKGKVERSRALAKLTEVYAQQWRRQQRAKQDPPRAEREQNRRREGQGQARRGLDSLERRVRILGIARAAYDKAGRERNERALAGAVRYGKLLIEDANEEAMAKAAEGLPSMGNLIELLQGAHNIWAEYGDQERAGVCHQLAQFYKERQRGNGAQEERERDRPRRLNLEDREQRVKILRWVHAAHAESGNRRAAERMKRILHFAELQLEGVTGEALAQAAEGLSQGMITELVQAAQNLYGKWGNEERAGACGRLANYYQKRAEGAAGGRERERAGDRERERERASDREQEREHARQDGIRELQQRVERLQKELERIQALLRKLAAR